MLVLRRSFPLSKLAFWSGLVNGSQAVGLVCAPVVGGVLIDRFGWRACFGINVPLMVFCIGFTFYGMQSQPGAASTDAEMVNLSLKEKLKRIDILGSVLIVPAIVCGLLGLQWGGVSYGWRDWRIILLFTLFGVLLTGFGYLQYRQGDDATVPLRILKKRSILAGMWYSACTNGLLATTEYYMAIYFQGVRGFTATRSGLLGLPMIAGLLGGMLAASAATAKIGYYYRECCTSAGIGEGFS
jgi:MFS family permease